MPALPDEAVSSVLQASEACPPGTTRVDQRFLRGRGLRGHVAVCRSAPEAMAFLLEELPQVWNFGCFGNFELGHSRCFNETASEAIRKALKALE